MKRRAILLAILAVFSISSSAFAQNKTAIEVKMEMRKLWEEHITYTRNYIISAMANLPDVDVIANRLLKNQDDIGDAIKPFYGRDAGNKLAFLLRDHFMIATEVIEAAKIDQKELLPAAQNKWFANGKEIAVFLSRANPNWSQKDLEDMLQKYLSLTIGEVVGRINNDWDGDIKSFDAGHEHMLMFADMLTDGLEKQFPNKF